MQWYVYDWYDILSICFVVVVALSLSLVRTSWLCLCVVVLIYLLFQTPAKFLKNTVILLLVACSCFGILTVSPFYSKISERLTSLANISSDVSFKARRSSYNSQTSYALNNMLGDGLGTTGLSVKLSIRKSLEMSIGQIDSGVLNTLNSLGWFGGSLYTLGLAMALVYAFPFSRSRDIASALFAVGLVCTIQMIAYSANISVQGYLMWMPLAMAMRLKKSGKIMDKPAFQRNEISVEGNNIIFATQTVFTEDR